MQSVESLHSKAPKRPSFLVAIVCTVVLVLAYNCRGLNAQVRPLSDARVDSRTAGATGQGGGLNQPIRVAEQGAASRNGAREPQKAPEPWIPAPDQKPIPGSPPNHQGMSSQTNRVDDSRVVRQPGHSTTNKNVDAQVQTASYEIPSDASLASGSQDASRKASIPLAPPSGKLAEGIERPKGTWASIVSMMASLGIVIGLFLGGAWLVRRNQVALPGSLPKEVVQLLGKCPLAPRQQVYLLRFGNRLLLVSHQLGQTTTLGEIDDPLEVDRIAGLCEQQSSNSVTQSFKQVFQQVTSGQPASRTNRA